MIEIIPSLPATSFEELESKIEKVRGLVTGFQIDICDGKFVNAVSWPLHTEDSPRYQRIVRGEERLPFSEDFVFEADLMIHHPEQMVPDLIRAGFSRGLIHIESEHDFLLCREAAQDTLELGIALSIGTDISLIEKYVPFITVVQFMGIAKIGSQGQPFDPRVLTMIRETRERYPNVIIEVDGAVNNLTAPELIGAGATRLAPGSYVLSSEDATEAIRTLQSLSMTSGYN